ncbi:hypothetical protein [Bacteroides sp. GM023]|uniref:hypothetical protein n=1 Tax=Bacteroides sp. GM023 TaxID=2723058 RepID=UPI00168A5E72|nr:hypothetical protein [Bacteroides sp. GM023]MBD3588421.1 hypothetical protein [Bacteroides sp. GM023]
MIKNKLIKVKLLCLSITAITSFACNQNNGLSEFNAPDKPEVTKDSLKIDVANIKWQISEYLTGSHFVYANEPDNLYKDSRISDWMERSKVKVIRWPGGTAVQNYHWDKLNGIAFDCDTWEPDYNSGYKDPANYMDLDEFIAFCRKVGAEPMVGINIKSGKKYNKPALAEDEARRLILHCKDSDYNVKYWYIGNEAYATGFGVKEYATYIDKYASILKSVNPNITIIADWKFGPQAKNRFNELIQVAKASEQLDIIEVHEKWAEGWGLISGENMEDWQKESPLYDGLLSSYTEKFYAEMDKAGKKVKLAMNEWGIGNIKEATPFENGLVAADYLIEIFRNKIVMACYWNLNMGNINSRILKVENYGTANASLTEISVIGNVFSLIAPAQGNFLINLENPIQGIHGFATINAAKKTVEIYLLNKNSDDINIPIQISNYNIEQGNVKQSTYSQLGNIIEKPYGNVKLKELIVSVPKMCFTRITIN